MARLELRLVTDKDETVSVREFDAAGVAAILEAVNDPMIARLLPSLPEDDGVVTADGLVDYLLEGLAKRLEDAPSQIAQARLAVAMRAGDEAGLAAAFAFGKQASAIRFADPSPSEAKRARQARLAAVAAAPSIEAPPTTPRASEAAA